MNVAAVAKVAIEVAKNLKDEKKREKILTLVLVSFLILFTPLIMLAFIIIAPIEDMLAGNEDTIGLASFKEQINIEYSDVNINDNDYALNYEPTIIKSRETEVVYYNQGDNPWKNMMYGTIRTIGISGCGPTSMAIVISTLNGQEITPEMTSNWSYQNGYLVQGYSNGRPYAMSSHSLIPALATEYNLNSTGIAKNSNTAEKIYQVLSSGKLVVAIMGPGHFTSGGHFIVLRGVTEKGKILVADCGSRQRTNQEWDIETIIREAKGNAGAGGPFWAIGNK
jgi:hypothetical protein